MIANLPFSALRAFEAVVRRAGFSAAADELGVSQSAVSQHVRTLEQWLGRDLLTRGSRQSVPTPDGLRLAQAISEGLGRISDVCVDLRNRHRNDDRIVVGCPPGFAFLWLFPRLMQFDQAHPDLSVSIATEVGRSPQSDVDIGIRYGYGDHPGMQVEHLMPERVFPVCAPSLLRAADPLVHLSDLTRQTLLQDEYSGFGADSPNWDFWARECGLTLLAPRRSRQFGQSNLVVQAAIEGIGVALGREPLVVDALRDGRLVRPFPQIARSPLSYWLVRPRRAPARAGLEAFQNWIHQAAATQPDIPDAVLS